MNDVTSEPTPSDVEDYYASNARLELQALTGKPSKCTPHCRVCCLDGFHVDEHGITRHNQ